MMRSRSLVLALALLAGGGLLGCKGLQNDSSTVEPPAVFAGQAAKACGTPGATAITADVVGTRVVLDEPITLPPAGSSANRAYVPGTVTGLAAGDSLYAVLLQATDDCPFDAFTEFAPNADGTFTAVVDFATALNFRIVIVSGPAGSSVTCDAPNGCLQLDAGGTTIPVTGISPAVAIRLP